ncbi:hypothetical protein TL16_g05155 [Triparma laevis f. inornata]|uniref:Potassium channel domain-containing protein n=2 Tax=Triparma laevis TaxID=1534972 RepID=A0A9W7C987_9STRA|nr:hypothetical protein TL16_g05155 [Triparma laevis f. inornata]GMI01573.1 hypothetical protein TrLO_g10216 [Triparma laevis f. longispina]
MKPRASDPTGMHIDADNGKKRDSRRFTTVIKTIYSLKSSVRRATLRRPSDLVDSTDVHDISHWHKGFSEQIIDVLDHKPRRNLQMIAVFLALLGFIFASIAAEEIYLNENEINDSINFYKMLSTISTAALIVVVLLMHGFDLSIEKDRGYVSPDSTIFSKGRHGYIWVDLLICAIHSPVYVHFVFKEEVARATSGYTPDGSELDAVHAYHTFDSVANVLMTARLYLLIPILHHFMGLTGTGPRLVAKYTNIIFDMHFTMKAILDRHSVVALFVAIIFIAAHGGWCYRALERPLCAFWLEDQWDTVTYGWGRCGLQQPTTFENFEDSFWVAVVTMTTVGYGDLVPVTMGGRIISIWCSFVGIVIIALLVNVMTTETTFRPKERKAFNLIKNGQYRKKTKLLAVLLVQACWRYHSHRKNPGRELTKFKKLYFRHYRNWKTNLRIILQNENKIDEVAILTTELGSLRRDFKEMLYHVTVDLEERLDRRMLRLGQTLNAQRAEERDQFRSLGHPSRSQ